MLTNVTNQASSENDLTIAPGQGGRRFDISSPLPALAGALLSGVVDLELALIDQLLDQGVLIRRGGQRVPRREIHTLERDQLIVVGA